MIMDDYREGQGRVNLKKKNSIKMLGGGVKI